MLRLGGQSNFSNKYGPMELQNRRRNLGGSLCEFIFIGYNGAIRSLKTIKRSDAFAKRGIFNWYNGANYSPRRLLLSGTTGQTIRQEGLLNDTRERIIR